MSGSSIVMISGGFDPLHSGHINYIYAARKLGDKLVVGLNSNDWLKAKKGRAFMSYEERYRMLMAVEGVDAVVSFDDGCGSAFNFIEDTIKLEDYDNYIFANGGDRNEGNAPEELGCYSTKINFVYGVGGDKTESSSELLNKYGIQITNRAWGSYTILKDDDAVKVKELIIEPYKSISYQKHFLRSEVWFVSKGKCTVKHSQGKRTDYKMHNLREDDVFTVRANEWHQIHNPLDIPCHIIEIQYGAATDEEDILRDDV